MTDTLAYQIGAVFFLAVLFMAGTLTRGLFPSSIFKNVKLTMFVAAALLVGLMVYRGLPNISSLLDLIPSMTTQQPSPAAPAMSTTDTAIKTSRAPRPEAKIREAQAAHQTASAPAATPQPQGAWEPESVPMERTRRSILDPPPLAASQSPDASAQLTSIGDVSAGNWRATPAQESGNPVKRAMKSVGHFLHIGHEKYQPPPSAPQPAAPTNQGKADGPP